MSGGGDPLAELVRATWARVLGHRPNEEDRFFAFGDSLALVEFAQSIEDATGLRFPLEQMLADDSLGSIVESLRYAEDQGRQGPGM